MVMVEMQEEVLMKVRRSVGLVDRLKVAGECLGVGGDGRGSGRNRMDVEMEAVDDGRWGSTMVVQGRR